MNDTHASRVTFPLRARPFSPVIVPEVDPTKAFYQFASQMRFDKKVKGLSLGQGQGAKASRLIEEASQKGTWVSGRLVFDSW